MNYLIIVFTLCGSLTAFGQKEHVTEYTMEESGLLWQITGENLTDTSYLFGTMHMIQKEYYIFPKQLESIAKNSDAIVMELAGMPDPYAMLKFIMMKDDTLWNHFSAEQEDTLMNWIGDNTTYEPEAVKSMFMKMKPFALIQLTTLSQFTGETESYEENFEAIAKADSIEMIGLETVADQMGIFDKISMAEQVEMVMASIRDPERAQQEIIKMQSTYFNQQIDELYMLIHEEGGTIAEKENEFLTERNKKWSVTLDPLLKEKELFIAVGAGHLGGPEGLIRLLQRQGFTLSPIQLSK